MKTLLKTLSFSLLIGASVSANAQWNVSGGYSSLNEDIEADDISLGAVYGSVGYTYDNDSLTFMPELRVGFGVGDDTVYGVDIEVDSLIVASVRAQYNVNEKFGVFLQPSYGRLEATASAGGESVSEDDWEFGFGGGASFKVRDQVAIEALYEAFDEVDVLSLGVRYSY